MRQVLQQYQADLMLVKYWTGGCAQDPASPSRANSRGSTKLGGLLRGHCMGWDGSSQGVFANTKPESVCDSSSLASNARA